MAFTPLKSYPNCGTQIVIVTFPLTVANSATWISPLLPAAFGGVVFGATADQIVTLQIQRYADLAGSVPVGVLETQVTIATTAAWVGFNDGLPFFSYSLAIVNASGSLANITNAMAITGTGAL